MMKAPHLIIRKQMQLIQGKVRPCCQVLARVEPRVQALLEEHFLAEPLFKRAAYAVNWPKSALEIPPALAPAMSVFLKNDTCPEITVKTILAGQLHQAANAWEMLCFELIAKLSFDNLLMLVAAAEEIDRVVIYHGQQSEKSSEKAGEKAGEAADADRAAEPLMSAGRGLAA